MSTNLRLAGRGTDTVSSIQPSITWGVTTLAIVGIAALVSSIVLVTWALATDDWFLYDAKYGKHIHVALNRPDRDGFTLDADGKWLRWVIQASNIAFLFIAIALLNSYRLLNRARGDLYHLIAIVATHLPLVAGLCAYGFKAALSRTETVYVSTNGTVYLANATNLTVRTYVGEGDRFSLDHPPRMVLAAGGCGMVFVFCLQFIVSVFSFYFYQKADLKYVNNAPTNIDGDTGFPVNPPAYVAKSA